MKKTPVPSATYVYCVARGARPPRLKDAPAGLPGASPPRSLAIAPSLWLVAADAPLARYGESAIEAGLRDLDWVGACAAGHERIVEHVTRVATTVPMKLFTLFADEERAIANTRKASRRIERVAKQIEGCMEWGVRVRLDEQHAREQMRRRATTSSATSRRGTSFLLQKRAEHTGLREVLRTARAEVDSALVRLKKHARASVERPAVSRELAARMLFDAVFLVPSKGAKPFLSTVRGMTSVLAKDGCEVTVSGPWPPYHFVHSAGRSKR